MSENWRMVGIAGAFLLIGGVIWFLLLGSGVEDGAVESVGEPEFGRRVGEVPAFEFDAVVRRGRLADSSGGDSRAVDVKDMAVDSLTNQVSFDENRDVVDVLPDDEFALRGIVRNTEGEALSNALIRVEPTPLNASNREESVETKADGDGGYRFDSLPLGNVEVFVEAVGYLTEIVGLELRNAENELDFVLNRSGVIEGHVYVDGEAQGSVGIRGNFGYAGRSRFLVSTTDSGGYYRLEGVLGNVSISAGIICGNDKVRLHSTVMTYEGVTTEFDFDFVSPSSFVEGYIMAGENQPSAGTAGLIVFTELYFETRSAKVGTDGYYLFENVPAGALTLYAHTKNNGASKRVFAELGENETLRLDVNLYGGVSVLYTIENLPDGYATQVYVLPADYSVPRVLTRESLMKLSQNSFQDEINFENGMSGFAMIEPGDYKIVAFGYNGDGVDWENEGGYWISAQAHVVGDEDVYVTLSFLE